MEAGKDINEIGPQLDLDHSLGSNVTLDQRSKTEQAIINTLIQLPDLIRSSHYQELWAHRSVINTLTLMGSPELAERSVHRIPEIDTSIDIVQELFENGFAIEASSIGIIHIGVPLHRWNRWDAGECARFYISKGAALQAEDSTQGSVEIEQRLKYLKRYLKQIGEARKERPFTKYTDIEERNLSRTIDALSRAGLKDEAFQLADKLGNEYYKRSSLLHLIKRGHLEWNIDLVEQLSDDFLKYDFLTKASEWLIQQGRGEEARPALEMASTIFQDLPYHDPQLYLQTNLAILWSSIEPQRALALIEDSERLADSYYREEQNENSPPQWKTTKVTLNYNNVAAAYSHLSLKEEALRVFNKAWAITSIHQRSFITDAMARSGLYKELLSEPFAEHLNDRYKKIDLFALLTLAAFKAGEFSAAESFLQEINNIIPVLKEKVRFDRVGTLEFEYTIRSLIAELARTVLDESPSLSISVSSYPAAVVQL